MLEYGFCNAVNGSPSYNADHFNNFFAGILSDTGIYKKSGGAFQVTAGGGMTVNVATGRGRIDNHWISLTASEVLAIEAAVTKDRSKIYQAAMLDPHTAAELNMEDICAMCDEMIEAHGEYMAMYK